MAVRGSLFHFADFLFGLFSSNQNSVKKKEIKIVKINLSFRFLFFEFDLDIYESKMDVSQSQRINDNGNTIKRIVLTTAQQCPPNSNKPTKMLHKC